MIFTRPGDRSIQRAPVCDNHRPLNTGSVGSIPGWPILVSASRCRPYRGQVLGGAMCPPEHSLDKV